MFHYDNIFLEACESKATQFNYVRSCLFIERDLHATSFFLFFSGARPHRPAPTRNRAPLKNKKGHQVARFSGQN